MTICFFSAQYLPTVGGVERYTFNLARRVVNAGHNAIVVTSALPGLPDTETDEHGIRIIRLPVWPLMNGRFPVLKPGKAFRALAAQLWATPIDFCLINTRFYVSSLYAAFQCRKRRVPAIVVDHSTGHLPMGNPVLNAAGAFYEHLAAAFLKACKPRFFGVSRAVCHWLEHFGIHPAGQLYNAVEPSEVRALAHAPDAVDWRARLGLPVDEKLVVFLGRVIPEKGVAELVDAFSSAGLSGCSLVVAGDGPLLPRLRENCPPGVHLAGAVPYAHAMQLLAQAQLYCLPTYYAEGFPTTFLEAAACGCPILTTRTGGSDELLPDESYGIQLDGVDSTSLAAALKSCLTDDAWRCEAARKTAARLEEHFTWDAVTRELLRLAGAQ
ncbi:glycosyltransferase family 4 protein [Allofournierella massiliensis]|uniref:glycosyltransferase family 4 protein n=1 Tax=Allofournierella massiliensis TaxID=1650663 RepID=UPI0039A1B3D6